MRLPPAWHVGSHKMRVSPADFHLIQSESGQHLFVVDGSRLYDILADQVVDHRSVQEILDDVVPKGVGRIDGTPLTPPPLQTLSLNVAQACNMGCGYCYAGRGAFGGKARLMSTEVARAAVDRLIVESRPGANLVIGFMGGEPFLNRPLLHDVMSYASRVAVASGRTVRFSLTTNATLLEPEDIDLLRRHRAHVTISIDGHKELNDAARPLNGGGSAYERVIQSLRLFDSFGRPRHLSARMTVTPATRELVSILDHVIGLGFDSAGFSPVLVSPDRAQEFVAEDFRWFLQEMIACGKKAADAVVSRKRYPFTNFETALQEIDRGSHRPYPCGAGAAYLSVNADGDMFACHRLVDDPAHRFGDVWTGSDYAMRQRHLAVRHVDKQEPCRSCWARYLCGGGCYHEVDRRGRPGCDYIRGWLEFCLVAYARLRDRAPGYFHDPDRYFDVGSSAVQ
jgi:uncharacterized protein